MPKPAVHRVKTVDGKPYCFACNKTVVLVSIPGIGASKKVCPEYKRLLKKLDRESAKKRSQRRRQREQRAKQMYAEWLFRQICWYRDEQRCQAPGCKRSGPLGVGIGSLQIHHLIKRSRSRALRLYAQNGITLCSGCHQTADRFESWGLSLIDDDRVADLLEHVRQTQSSPLRSLTIDEWITRLRADAKYYLGNRACWAEFCERDSKAFERMSQIVNGGNNG